MAFEGSGPLATDPLLAISDVEDEGRTSLRRRLSRARQDSSRLHETANVVGSRNRYPYDRKRHIFFGLKRALNRDSSHEKAAKYLLNIVTLAATVLWLR